MKEENLPYQDEDFSPLEKEGWQAMQGLLDHYLPVQKEKDRKVIPLFWRWMAAAVVVGFAVGVYFLLQNDKVAPKTGIVSTQINKNTKDTLRVGHLDVPVKSNQNVQTGALAAHTYSKNNQTQLKPFPFQHIRQPIIKNKIEPASEGRQVVVVLQEQKGPSLLLSPTLTTLGHIAQNKILDQGATAVNADISVKKDSFQWSDPYAATKEERTASIAPITKTDSTVLAVNDEWQKAKIKALEDAYLNDQKTIPDQSKAIDIALQLNRNISTSSVTGNSLYDLPVYPSVLASIRLNKLFSITTGVTANAPGAMISNGNSSAAARDALNSVASSSGQNVIVAQNVQGLTPLNASAKLDAYAQSNLSNQYVKQAFYWQVPILLDVWVMKHVKASAGANLAFTQKIWMAADNGAASTNGQLMNYSNFQEFYGDNLRFFDPRMTLGLQYLWKKMSFGGSMSRSIISSTPNGALNGAFSNQLFNVSFGYKLFK